MRKDAAQSRIQAAKVFFVALISIFIVLSLWFVQKDKTHRDFSVSLARFKSDFIQEEESKALYEDQVFKKNRFFAFGTYVSIPRGVYEGTFSIASKASQPAVVSLQVAAEQGREILFNQELRVDMFPFQHTVSFKIDAEKEVEPRVLFVSGSTDLRLEKVLFHRGKGVFPWKNTVLLALYAALLASLLILAVMNTFKPSSRWKLFLAFFFFLLGFSLILRNAWISEDAFITLRHVDNFLNGYGPVFNPGERVEGYTHPLWFAILSLFRWLGLSPKGSFVLPGLLFSLAALYILFFKIRFSTASGSGVSVNPAAVILIGTSAFIDFGTSGLETSLSCFLLVLYAKFIAENRWKSQPLLMGLIVSLLVLTRPDFGVFLVLMIVFYLYELLRKTISFRLFLHFLIPSGLILGLHELFRMGYYAALMPNPFYTKSGSAAYFAQGIRYLVDFGRGSLIFVLLFLVVLAMVSSLRQDGFKARLLIFISGAAHGFFVIRGGGDFMHGRFLLPAVLLLCAASSGAFDRLLENKAVMRNAAVVASLVLFTLSLITRPIQKRGTEISHGISNERHYYYKDKIIPINYLFKDTMIFMWKTMGQNYGWLSEEARLNIRLAFTNVGFLGYYSGTHIYLIDRLGLTDPVISRIFLEKRERPGHEKHAPFGYLMLRKLTFGETPFPLWNETAATRYGVLWDLSPRTLKKIQFFLDEDFKKTVDVRIAGFLGSIKREDYSEIGDFLFFLKEFWYPYASAEDRSLFDNIYDEGLISLYSTSYQWIEAHREDVELLLSQVQGPLTAKKFFENIVFSLTKGRALKF